MSCTIRLNAIQETSICDGPGIRTVLYFQGCHRRCVGCHNPGTWDSDGGVVWEITHLLQYIREHVVTKRITLSGGEPLEQMEGVTKLLRQLREEEYDVALYTGFELDEIPSTLLELVNYVKTGNYRKDLRTTTVAYIGSINQSFISIRGGDAK